MNRYLQRLWATVTLPVKGLVLGLLCGILTWTVLSSFESRNLEAMLLERTHEQLRDEAASNRMIFHRYLKQHVQLTKLIASYQPLVTWLEQKQRSGQFSELVHYENERPDWFPPLSTWRGLINPGGFLLQDAEGSPKAIYRLAANDLPIDRLLQNSLATGRGEGQIHLVALDGQPHLIASSMINDASGHKLGYLTLISRIDNRFVSKLSYATDAPNVILALLEGDGQHLIASSQPQRLASDVGLNELRRDYLVTGKPFFDYGSSELRLQLATLIPLDRMAAFNEHILDSAQEQHLIAAVAFTLTFTLLIYSWSRRIEGVLKHIHTFSEHVLGTSKEFKVRGDALLRLEDDFPRLQDEILAARQSLSEQQRTSQRLKQLELLETVADHLEIGVVLLGPGGEKELQTRQMDRFARTLGEGWYQPLIQQSVPKKEVDLEDKLQNQYTFKASRLSLFAQDDVVLVQNVTEEKRLQRQLRVQETRFRHITESARDAIISIDRSGAVVYWNRSAEDMFQYSAPESIGKPITHIMPESYRKAHQSAIDRVAKGGSAHSVGKILELDGLRKDGTVFPVELSLSAWQMDGNLYYTGILRDITEREQAQQALQESQSRFALFMDRLPAAAFIKDAQSRVLYVNQYLSTHFAARSSQGAVACEHSAETNERIVRDDRKALAEGQLDLVERLTDRTGQERTFRTLKFAIPRAEGEPPLLGGIAWDITEALAAAESLASSKRRYREIFDMAQEGIWLIDADANTVEVNERMAEMLGYSGDEMRGRHLFHFMDEQARKEAIGYLERRRQGISEKYDFRFRTKTGDDCWAIVSSAPMCDSNGDYAGALRMVTDITERKRAEDALRAHEEQLRLILASTGEGIFGLDMNGCCTFANRACIDLLGYKDEKDLLGKRMHELIHHTRQDGTDYPVEECPTYRSCTFRHVTFADDELLWRADGGAFHAQYQSFPMLREDSVVGAVVSFADTTERRRAKADIKRERDFAESLIETAPVIVLVLDLKGNIVRFNSFMEQLSGYSLAEVKGKNWFDTFPVERGACQITDVLARIQDGDARGENLHAIVTRNGKEHLIAWHNTTLRDPNGEVTALLAIGHDVTNQKAKEAQLAQAQKMEMVGQLTGGIAHDFNNLLTVVMGNLELLNRSLGQDPDAAELLQDALSAAQDGAELTQRLLAYSRKTPLRQKRLDLPAFLSHSQRFLRRTLGANIAVEMDVDPHIGELFCDPHQLESALLNLALNARDAMPDGGRLCLQAHAKQGAYMDPTLDPGEYVEIAVIDTGTGMTNEQLAHAIEPFYTTKGSKQGSGLGLSMVFNFCRQTGGRFRLASETGVGTRASIVLPLTNDKGEEAKPALESKPRNATDSGRVLVVEDEQRVRKLAARYLQDLGYDVLEAENGDLAIEVLESGAAIDLVFTDIVMPGTISGEDLYRWIREHRPDLKVLLTTGLRSPEIPARSQNGNSTVPITLPKPYTKEQLAEAIGDLMAI